MEYVGSSKKIVFQVMDTIYFGSVMNSSRELVQSKILTGFL